jgi:hypothetical protein
VQVSIASGFNNILKDSSGITDTTLILNNLSNNTIFYWRVMAINTSDTSEWAIGWSFTTILGLPAVIILVSPVNASLFIIDSIDFVWHKGDVSITKYWIDIATDSDFTNIYSRDSSLIDTTIRYKSILNNSYWWRVKSQNAASWGPYSLKRIFTINKPMTYVSSKNINLQSFANNRSEKVLYYVLPHMCYVTIKYSEISGRMITSIVNQTQNAGSYSIPLSIFNWANGIYIQEFKAGDFLKNDRFVIMR